MRIAHVIDSVLKRASGPSYSVVSLCTALARRGHEVELHVLAPAPDLTGSGFTLHAHPRGGFPKRLGRSPAAREALREAAGRVDLIHTHGLWRAPHIYGARAVDGLPCKLVTSPRGALSPWARSWHPWRKRLMWWTVQRSALARAHLFHATSDREVVQIREAGFDAPVVVIANGIDVPEALPPKDVGPGPRRLLFLGRIHPIKGVDRLIEAWRRVQDAAPDWHLDVVGFDEAGYAGEMAKHAVAIGAERVRVLGPMYDAEKEALLCGADLFVLPSHTENFGVAVAEALARGVPAIASRGTPWEDLVPRGCGWWVEGTVEGLEACLREALVLPRERLQAMGAKGRAWMQQDLAWPRLAQQMEEAYRWLLGGGPPPGSLAGGPNAASASRSAEHGSAGGVAPSTSNRSLPSL